MPRFFNGSSKKYAHSPRIPFSWELTSVSRSASPKSSTNAETTSKPAVTPLREIKLQELTRVVDAEVLVLAVAGMHNLDGSYDSQVIPPSRYEPDTTILGERNAPEEDEEGEGEEGEGEAEEEGEEDEGEKEKEEEVEEKPVRLGKYFPYRR